MKDRGEDRRAHGKPVWFRRTIPALPAAVLIVVAAGCHEPQADISSTAAGLQTVVTRQVQAPAAGRRANSQVHNRRNPYSSMPAWPEQDRL
jgi:hypothetical protein